MTDRQYGEKDEKDEKDEEKSWDEKWRRDPLSALVWAIILIWAGVVLLAENLGFLTRFEWVEAWGIIFVGAGLIVLLEVAVRLLVPSYRRGVGGTLFFAVMLLGIGLGSMFGWNLIWPLILIALGVSALVSGLFRGR
jgi:hypothetical protein